MNSRTHFAIASILGASLCLAGCEKEPAPSAAPARPLSAASQAAAAASAWTLTPVAGGLYTVRSPGALACSEREVGAGMKSVSCITETKSTAMMVMTTQIPAGAVDESNVDLLLMGSVERAAKSANGAAESVRDIAFGGLKGKDFMVATGKNVIQYRILVGGNYLAQSMAMPRGEFEASEGEMKGFVESLLPKANP